MHSFSLLSLSLPPSLPPFLSPSLPLSLSLSLSHRTVILTGPVVAPQRDYSSFQRHRSSSPHLGPQQDWRRTVTRGRRRRTSRAAGESHDLRRESHDYHMLVRSSSTEVTRQRYRTSLGTQTRRGWCAVFRKTIFCKSGKWWVWGFAFLS